jgi:hypothetical protein
MTANLRLSDLGNDPSKHRQLLHAVCRSLEVPNRGPGTSALGVSTLRWRGRLSAAPLEQRRVDRAGPLPDDICPRPRHRWFAEAVVRADAIQVLIADVLADGDADAPVRAARPVPTRAAACPGVPNAFAR